MPPKIGSGSYIDVRDVARMCLWVLQHPKLADGERYIAVTGSGIPQAAADILHRAYPERASIMPVGNPGDGYNHDYSWRSGEISVSGQKAQKVMGPHQYNYEQSVLDTAHWFTKFAAPERT
jgi:nucleoside-diphosphate-sugar epimerase